jgi:translation initiation factor IF-2
MPEDMRCPYHLLLSTAILAAPIPVAAQVTIDPNALNALGPAALPEPPPAASPAATHRSHRYRSRHLAQAERTHSHGAATAVASTATAAAPGAVALEHPKNLGPSFTSLPPLPQAPPPLPAPPTIVTAAPKVKPAAPKPVETAQASPSPAPSPPPKPAAPQPAPASAPTPMPPQLALPAGVPPPPAPPPARLAEATPGPSAAGPPAAGSPPAAPNAAPDALPKGADLMTLPFSAQDSDLPPTETAMLRDFAQRHGAATQYIVRAFAAAPPGDDDPSTPRRVALARAQSVASALFDSGAQPDTVRLLALGDAGGSPPNRVEVIAMPPPSGHTASQSSP